MVYPVADCIKIIEEKISDLGIGEVNLPTPIDLRKYNFLVNLLNQLKIFQKGLLK